MCVHLVHLQLGHQQLGSNSFQTGPVRFYDIFRELHRSVCHHRVSHSFQDVFGSLHAGNASLEGRVVGLDGAPHLGTLWLHQIDHILEKKVVCRGHQSQVIILVLQKAERETPSLYTGISNLFPHAQMFVTEIIIVMAHEPDCTSAKGPESNLEFVGQGKYNQATIGIGVGSKMRVGGL